MSKKSKALSKEVIKRHLRTGSRETEFIIADNSDKIRLTICKDYGTPMVENEQGTMFEVKALSEREMDMFIDLLNLSMYEKKEDDDDVTINIPFSYTLGDVGYYTGKVLRTIQDCKTEVIAEIENGVLNENINDIYLEVKED